MSLLTKVQIDCFLKRGPRFHCKERDLVHAELREKECSMEIVATIAGGYEKGITRSTWMAQMRGT